MLRAKISESLRISVLDLLSYRIPEATGSPTVRWLRIPGKHKPIWRSLYLEMIIKKRCINQLISEKIIRKWERTLSTGTVRLAEKGLNIFKNYWWNFHFHSRSVTNQCKMYIRVTKENPHYSMYNLTNEHIFVLANHMIFLTGFLEQDKSKL